MNSGRGALAVDKMHWGAAVSSCCIMRHGVLRGAQSTMTYEVPVWSWGTCTDTLFLLLLFSGGGWW